MSNSEHVTDLLPGYVLGSLNENETLRVARHLPSCALCRQELQRHWRTFESLGISAPEVNPSDTVWQRIEARVATDDNGAQRAPTVPPTESEQPVQNEAPPVSHRSRLVAGRRSFAAVLVASVVVILGLAITTGMLWLQQTEQPARLAGMLVFKLSSAPQHDSEARGLVVCTDEGARGTLIVKGLPTMENGATYRLWLENSRERLRGPAFAVDEQGYASVMVDAARPLTDFSRFAVTIEPADSGGAAFRRPVLDTHAGVQER